MCSLPVPVSPMNSTGEGSAATRATETRKLRVAGAWPGIASRDVERRIVTVRHRRRLIDRDHGRSQAHHRAVGQRQPRHRAHRIDERPIAAAEIHAGVKAAGRVPLDREVLARYRDVADLGRARLLRLPPQHQPVRGQRNRRRERGRHHHAQLRRRHAIVRAGLCEGTAVVRWRSSSLMLIAQATAPRAGRRTTRSRHAAAIRRERSLSAACPSPPDS